MSLATMTGKVSAPSGMADASARAQVVARRSYSRPLDAAGTIFETWPQTVARVIDHQRWLWESALGGSLTANQEVELEQFRVLILARKAFPAGRTLWMGGTEIVRRRPASNFNCAAICIRTVHDVADLLWLLLQGTGVGFRPISGTLSGFTRRMEVEVVRSTRTAAGGRETNRETYDSETRTWTISIGDSAEAWAKVPAKMLAGKFPARKLVLDFSEIRPAGSRLKGYGWICSGDRAMSVALTAIAAILNCRAGKLLTKADIWDIVNWLGTVLSNRRSAQAGLIDHGDSEWRTIATFKPPGYWEKNPQRAMSNNSLIFSEWPGRRGLRDIFEMMIAHGGGEPGFINGAAALRRAPWFSAFNPCFEIILSDKGFCNLVELDLAKFRDDHVGVHEALRIVARANYRQTLVDLRDGVLQDAWHQNNQYLRLCGVGLTGIVRRGDLTPYDFRQLRRSATAAAYSMADELDLERPKNTTTVKPSGSLSKVADTTEGCHKPLGRYIFNNVQFNRHDPLLGSLCDSGYRMFDHPTDPDGVVVTFPVAWEDVDFEGEVGGAPVNLESAVSQLERYRMLQDSWCDQNVSCTISYDPSEVPAMVKWFEKHWDSYVATAFLFRNDPTKTAEQIGFAYLPQIVTTREAYEEYVAQLRPVDLGQAGDIDADLSADCPTGTCPVR